MRCLAHVDADIPREEPGTRNGRLLAQPLAQVDRLLHDGEGPGELTGPIHGLGEHREKPGAPGIVPLEERGCPVVQIRSGVEVAALECTGAGRGEVRRGACGDLR